jgi:chromosomal replication initiator protein
VSAELDQIWARVQAELAGAVDEPTYRIWLQPLRVVNVTDSDLTIEASPQAGAWIRERFGGLLRSCVTAAFGRELSVVIATGSGAPADQRALSERPGGTSNAPPAPLGNPRYTFDQFVIGDANRLAHAAALAVAELPGQAYNPLFICGPPPASRSRTTSA